MIKRFIAGLLACALLVGSVPESAAAVQVSAQEELQTETTAEEQEPQTEALAEEQEPQAEIQAGLRTDGKFAGGLKKTESREADFSGELFEKSADSTGKGSAIYSAEWDSYSTNYYYNRMNSAQRKLWDTLDQMCASYLAGTESVTAKTDGSGDVIYPTKGVSVTDLSQQDMLLTARIFMYSNPQYYFLDTTTIYSGSMGLGSIMYLILFPAFANGNVRAAATSRMKNVIDGWMAQINVQPDALQKEKLAHDLICQKMEYDPNYNNARQNEYNQVAYSVFCTDTTVCAGYSQAMQLLMNGAGIDCAIVTSEEHEWNIIRLNGSWYYVDLTWDDLSREDAEYFGISDGIGYQYFNRSKDAYLNDTQSASGWYMHATETFWNPYLPGLTHDSGASWQDIGTIFAPAGTLAAPQIYCIGDTVTFAAPSGGDVYYTLNGTQPSDAFTRSERYTGGVVLSQPALVRAVAVADGYLDSVVSETYVIPTCTVTFHANGGYINAKSVQSASKTLNCGSKVGKLFSPKRKGYAFLGWYTGKSGGSRITEDTVASSGKTYYAHWAKIKKAKASVSSLKNSKGKKLLVKIKNVKTATGYQIRYSTNQNMSSAKKKTISETSVTLKNLKKGRTYYVQVRMYQKESVSGKKTYGPWSKEKFVKIKK